MKDNPSNNFYEDLKKIYEKEDGNLDAYNSEYPVLKKVFDSIIESDFKNNYEFIEPIGRGGAGIVLCVNDINLNSLRALKLPRPKDPQLIESVRNEIDYLTDIKHENIIKVYSLGQLEIESYPSLYPYFVMDYIDDAIDLRKKILLKLEEANTSKDLKDITSWIANKFRIIAKAVNYLHTHDIIHFDIKPSNILRIISRLVDKNKGNNE